MNGDFKKSLFLFSVIVSPEALKKRIGVQINHEFLIIINAVQSFTIHHSPFTKKPR
jgi:hypothetical protein